MDDWYALYEDWKDYIRNKPMKTTVFLEYSGEFEYPVHLVNPETDECACGATTYREGEWLENPEDALRFGVDLSQVTCKRCLKTKLFRHEYTNKMLELCSGTSQYDENLQMLTAKSIPDRPFQSDQLNSFDRSGG